jgi:glutamate synthase (NADPH) small chain
MGKPTGFMERQRLSEAYEPAEARLKHYREFVATLNDEQASVQGSRCMDCGIPFCNSGCPVNNIIPDWNDLVYRGKWKQALAVLHSTNNFPDFTGTHLSGTVRSGVHAQYQQRGRSGSNRSSTRSSTKGWQMGWIVPQPAKVKTGKKVAISRLRAGRPRCSTATGARRARRDGVREEQPSRRTARLRYSRLQTRQVADRATSQADGG